MSEIFETLILDCWLKIRNICLIASIISMEFRSILFTWEKCNILVVNFVANCFEKDFYFYLLGIYSKLNSTRKSGFEIAFCENSCCCMMRHSSLLSNCNRNTQSNFKSMICRKRHTVLFIYIDHWILKLKTSNIAYTNYALTHSMTWNVFLEQL